MGKISRRKKQGNSSRAQTIPAPSPDTQIRAARRIHVPPSPVQSGSEANFLSLLSAVLRWIIGTLAWIFLGVQKRDAVQLHRPPTPLSDAEVTALVTYEVLDAILSRGVDQTLESLKEYLLKLLSDPKLHPITIPLLKGLWLGAPAINEKVLILPGQDKAMSLLFYVCQWKFLKVFGNWPAEAELVDMVLEAGANVHETLSNKTNPFFFAVKYADLHTVELLLEAGCNVNQKDKYGRTCLYNAIEHPQPLIIKKLLEYLPTTETFEQMDRGGSNRRQATLVDQLVNLLVQPGTPMSWNNLGPPSAESLSETLLLLRKKGVRFSPEGSSLPLYVLGLLFQSNVQVSTSKVNNPVAFKKVAKALIGQRIPEAYKSSNQAFLDDDEDARQGGSSGLCFICHTKKLRKPVSLYCGHSFCRHCIMDHGKETNGGHCPVCYSQLCPDLHTQSPLLLKEMLGLKNSPEYGGNCVARLTDDQVVAEARFQGIYSRAAYVQILRSKLQEGLERGYRTAATQAVSVDLAAAVSIFNDTRGFVCPKGGRVCIEVSVLDVPVLARISNRSLYTVVSTSVVDQLRLPLIAQLKSPKFVCALVGKKIRNMTFTCLEPFTLRVGEIEVTLRNALAVDVDPYPMFGIQLGLDFLSSGVWCPIDVKIEAMMSAPGPSAETLVCMRVDGEMSWMISGRSKEMLRYYSHDGGVAHLPLLHFSPFNKTVSLGISLKEGVKFDQCFWCCRAFPEGMLGCEPCEDTGRAVTYCDVRCQKAAWKIHKKMHDQD